jgi:HPt (histidine-containing phosphotransfer) domain-containing protein
MTFATVNAMPAAPATALDRHALARLAELDPGGKAGLVQRVLSTYLASLHRLMLQAEQARQAADRPGQPDLAALRYVAHTLKSSSASVGAHALADHCLNLEHRAASGLPQDINPLLDAMLAEAQRVSQAVRALLPQP